jgi:cysteine synthase B
MDTATVGNTPLVELDLGVSPTVYGKVEWFNLGPMPHGGGSVKARIGKAMLDAAEARGDLDDDPTILEASSGNTGAAVARIATERGYDVEIVTPDDAGRGKLDAIRDAGAEVRTVPSDEGYDAFVAERDRLAAQFPDRYHKLDQYSDPTNPAVHAATTGVEIYRQTDGEVTAFVGGMGSAGTVVGVGTALSDRSVSIHGYEPADGAHDIAGLKAMHLPDHFVPTNYDPAVVDDHHIVDTPESREFAHLLRDRHESEIPIRDAGRWSEAAVREHLRVDGEFIVGPSSGGCAALIDRLCRRGALDSDDVVVFPLADRGDRYPDRDLWADVI